MNIASRTLSGPARVLLVMDQPVLTEVVKLALDHGVHHPRVVQTAEEATAVLTDWRPHLAVVDMDVAGGAVPLPPAHRRPPAPRPPGLPPPRPRRPATDLCRSAPP